MSQTPLDDPAAEHPDGAPTTDDEDRPPDESTLLGATGVQEEVLAELARAEGEMSTPSTEDDSDDTGAQV